MVIFEQDTPNKRTNRYIPLSATLIASILLAFSPKEHVMAQETEDDNSETETKNLYTKYHSLLNEIDQEDEGEASVDLESESRRELSAEEVKAIQEQLILFLENEGDTDLAEAMKVEVATVGELEELFGSLLEVPVIEDESEEVEDFDEAEFVEVEEADEQESTEAEEEVEESDEAEFVEAEESNEQEPTEVEEIVAEEEPAEVETAQVAVAQSAAFSVKTTAQKSVSYTVKAGDTLNKIAREHNVTVDHIAKLNNISNINLISVGQVLAIHGNKVENAPAGDLGNLGKPMNNNEFIEYLGGHASVAAKEQNLYASVMIAQAALESGFGTSGLSSSPNHNLYGMKGTYQGDSVVMRTREYSTAKGWHYVNAHFKKYPSYLESLLDHSAYIRRGPSWGPEFYSGVWIENTTRYQDATSWLQGRYATDPTYASKLNRIIESYNLTRFDATGEGDLVVQPPANNTRPEQDVKPSTGDKEADSTPSNKGTYTVKGGDTLSHIARVYKMSVRELKELNNLRSDLILVGQRLIVKGNVTESKPTPTPTPAPSRPAETSTTSYTVKRGDTLSQIAPRYKMSVRELKELNNLKSDLILIGQRLTVKRSVAESTPAPTPTPTPSKPTISNDGVYTVKGGDTLSHIAHAYKMSVRELKELNNLRSDLILVGQRLTVKGSVVESKPTPTPTPAPSRPTTSSSGAYTIKSGDTLWHIARAHKMSVRELKELNNLKSDLIRVGQSLKVKRNVVTPSSTPTPTVTPSKPATSNSSAYTVKGGDTLSHIARAHKMSVRELKELNNLKSDLILIGQQLKINQKEKVSNTPSVQSYQIKAGDTLSHLARKFNTTVASLKAKNNLKSDLIFVNQRLTI